MARVVVAGGGISIPHELGDADNVVALRIHTLKAMVVGSKLGITALRLGNHPTQESYMWDEKAPR